MEQAAWNSLPNDPHPQVGGGLLHLLQQGAWLFGGVSFEFDLPDLVDKCVRIVGTIENYKGRPAIIIESRNQVLPCLGKE
jgi:hypothetical protein